MQYLQIKTNKLNLRNLNKYKKRNRKGGAKMVEKSLLIYVYFVDIQIFCVNYRRALEVFR